jgi:hypothetical protein
MKVVWLGRVGFMLSMLALGVSAAFFLASFGDASWVEASGLPLMYQLSTLLYGSLIVAMVLNVPLGLALRHAAKVAPSARSSLPRILMPLWPVGIMILVGLVLLFGALYVTTAWVMPPLGHTQDALARFTEASATRTLRSTGLILMGLSLVYGGLLLSWLYRYARLSQEQSATLSPDHASRPEQRPGH